MKKITLIVFSLLLFTFGCDNMMNTPTKKAEEFLNKYQRRDSEIIEQLDSVIRSDVNSFSEKQMEDYKNLMLKQYKDLTYVVKEEMIDGNNATVTVEIEVYDFNKALNEAETYYINNSDQFKDETGNMDSSKYMDYKIEKMNDTKERVKYTINLTLSKIDKNWSMNNITEVDRQKIHGLYNS